VRRFYAEAARIHAAAGEPYLEAPFEGPLPLLRRVARRGVGALASGLRLGTLDGLAARHFRTPHLRQFVGRFATYAGASPFAASAAYAVIPHLERTGGVHHVRGGMAALAGALGTAIERLGVTVRCGRHARWLPRGRHFLVGPAGDEGVFDAVVVNEDPLAGRAAGPLALSGYVLLLGARVRLPLPHHTVLFAADYRAEFEALFGGRLPADPTVYVCHPAATDPTMAPEERSGLYVMVNAPTVVPGTRTWEAEAATLRARVLARLEAEWPGLGAGLAVLGERTPLDFARQGAPGGSLYGFLPHGRLAAFARPRMRGRPPGVFFAGGGTHPGGGVPLVLLSGRFAAGMALDYLERRAAA
jgi:phytoene dehydrogenase-like protein